jgi:hypothetical protein
MSSTGTSGPTAPITDEHGSAGRGLGPATNREQAALAAARVLPELSRLLRGPDQHGRARCAAIGAHPGRGGPATPDQRGRRAAPRWTHPRHRRRGHSHRLGPATVPPPATSPTGTSACSTTAYRPASSTTQPRPFRPPKTKPRRPLANPGRATPIKRPRRRDQSVLDRYTTCDVS